MSDNYQPRNPYAPHDGARPAGNYGAAPNGPAPDGPTSAPAALPRRLQQWRQLHL